MQMQIPCRAASCEHLQCFDGWYYIRMNEMKPTWICPICDRPAKLKDLRVDGSVNSDNIFYFCRNYSWISWISVFLLCTAFLLP